ncbi:phospholipase/Carboxylesterase superfamily protein [Lepidopterella palustris CBS 459.81]|uniref:Phospholipase/Carboxylesterase superfamily protein n=1 Tax=Lepidopterella palustris CBS 459.81 TaxID=1314670 RepID=A0A8E2E343_9PEZI|nr:phospholipase/Carboxylesterase superfamily protein [Lepidopterella palustris CBS 459.81]
MPGRLPTRDDFPTSIILSVTPPSSSQPPTNVLILLHGLGDTNASFTTLGQRLNLPETACISIQAPNPLPFDLGGFHWGDDIVFDQASGEMDVDTGFKSSTRLVLENVIRKGLVEKCGYKPREIIMFGFGQGGMVGLQVATEFDGEELGGVISIGGVVPSTLPLKALSNKSRTPVIVCKGSKNSIVTQSAISRMKDAFESVEVKEWRKSGDGMPSNREEMLPIMQFFARRLRSVKGVPEGSVELA